MELHLIILEACTIFYLQNFMILRAESSYWLHFGSWYYGNLRWYEPLSEYICNSVTGTKDADILS